MKGSTPPVGPSTIAGLTTILVGLVGAALSLCGVVVDDETTQQIGVIVGGLVALGALAWTTWSRTRQAQTLTAARSSWGVMAGTNANPTLGQTNPMPTSAPAGFGISESRGEFSREPTRPHPDELRDLHDGDQT